MATASPPSSSRPELKRPWKYDEVGKAWRRRKGWKNFLTIGNEEMETMAADARLDPSQRLWAAIIRDSYGNLSDYAVDAMPQAEADDPAPKPRTQAYYAGKLDLSEGWVSAICKYWRKIGWLKDVAYLWPMQPKLPDDGQPTLFDGEEKENENSRLLNSRSPFVRYRERYLTEDKSFAGLWQEKREALESARAEFHECEKTLLGRFRDWKRDHADEYAALVAQIASEEKAKTNRHMAGSYSTNQGSGSEAGAPPAPPAPHANSTQADAGSVKGPQGPQEASGVLNLGFTESEGKVSDSKSQAHDSAENAPASPVVATPAEAPVKRFNSLTGSAVGTAAAKGVTTGEPPPPPPPLPASLDAMQKLFRVAEKPVPTDAQVRYAYDQVGAAGWPSFLDWLRESREFRTIRLPAFDVLIAQWRANMVGATALPPEQPAPKRDVQAEMREEQRKQAARNARIDAWIGMHPAEYSMQLKLAIEEERKQHPLMTKQQLRDAAALRVRRSIDPES